MRKSLLCILLAMLMCMSLLFVSCDSEDVLSGAGGKGGSLGASASEEFTPSSAEIAKGKAVVVRYLQENAQSETISPEEMTQVLENLTLEGDFAASSMGEEGEISLRMKNGLLYMSMPDDEIYVLFRNSSIFTFSSDWNGEWYLSDKADMEDLLNPENGDDEEQMILSFLKNMSFVNITVNDLAYRDGKFVLKNEYLASVVVDVMIELNVDNVQELEAEELDAFREEAVAEFGEMLEMLGAQIGFGVEEDEVTELSFSVNVGADAMREMDMIYSDGDAHVKVEFKVSFADAGTTIREISLMMDLYEDNVMDTSMNFNVSMFEDRIMLRGSGSVLQYGTTESFDIDGTVSMGGNPVFPPLPPIVEYYLGY